MRALIVFVSLLVIPLAATAQSDRRPEILVLGTYHMANPGRDVHNMQADDVLSPKRQQEIAQLIEVLKRFRPTKIAVEAHVASRRVPQEYAEYRAGRYTLSRNEVDQIGYRLAKELGHRAIYPVDEDGEFPYLRVLNYAKANGLKEKFDSLQASTGARVKIQGEILRTHTVLETLEYMNADSTVAKDVASYYAFVPFGEPYEYAGADLVARWFERNIRIYRNIVALVTSPDDRVLVIYGSGHLGWLRQNVEHDASVRLRKLADIVTRQRGGVQGPEGYPFGNEDVAGASSMRVTIGMVTGYGRVSVCATVLHVTRIGGDTVDTDGWSRTRGCGHSRRVLRRRLAAHASN
jgi:hypothetical protein